MKKLIKPDSISAYLITQYHLLPDSCLVYSFLLIMSVISFIPLRDDDDIAAQGVERELEYKPNEKCTRVMSGKKAGNIIVKYDSFYQDFVKKQFFNTTKPLTRVSPGPKKLPPSALLQSLKQPRNNIDHLFGFICSLLLYVNFELVTQRLGWCYEFYAIRKVEVYVRWLMGWPAGLKLNNNLDRFLGEMFLWLLAAFRDYLRPQILLNYLIHLAVPLSFFIGLSPLLALFSDGLYLLGLHFILFHRIASRLYQWQVRSLMSLFHLFRGKKWNVLRTRMDSNDYDLDQLLLGTVLFTLLFFGFPTIVVYYVLFGAVRLMQQVMHTALGIGLALLGALRDQDDRVEVEGFHFEQQEQDLLLVIEESSRFSRYLRSVKRQIHIPRLNLKQVLLVTK